MFIQNCRLIDFPVISDTRGSLSVLESERHVPFTVRRVFYLYDVPREASRGAHAHKELHQLMVCVSGCFDVIVCDGLEETRFHLNRPSLGLYVPPMIWDTEINFSPQSVCLVLASDYYDESDYYRNYEDYLAAVTAARARLRPEGMQSTAAP